jgi:PAB-dependent poly(A)-specific ribonuclease subunit 3
MMLCVEFVRMVMLLLNVADGAAFSWRTVSAFLGERLLLEMDSLAMFNEQLLEELSKEMENGRLFRLVSKLGFVTDRPADVQAQGQTAAWSETGDRYMLQLFKDFVFHQGELDGGRVIDWGHTIEALNKLDAGVTEQVLLQSRDERSLLVVSYADIKRCVEAAISELRTKGNGVGAGGVGPLMRPHAAVAGLGTAPAAHMYGAIGR